MKNSRIILILLFLVSGIALNAQQTSENTQTLCTQGVESYIVDASDASPEGSYAWTLTDASGTDLNAQITGHGNNQITIDWSNTAFDSYTLPYTFTMTVTETVEACPGETQTFYVQLIEGYEAPEIANVTPVCTNDEDDNAFNLTEGTPNAVVSYTITSDNGTFTTITSTVTLDASGNGSIPYPDLTETDSSETFTLTLTSIDDTGSDSCDALSITTNNTATVVVNPIPVTSPITPN